MLHTAYGDTTAWDYLANIKRLIKQQTFNAKTHTKFFPQVILENNNKKQFNIKLPLYNDLNTFYKKSLSNKNNKELINYIQMLAYNLTKKDLIKRGDLNFYALDPQKQLIKEKKEIQRLME